MLLLISSNQNARLKNVESLDCLVVWTFNHWRSSTLSIVQESFSSWLREGGKEQGNDLIFKHSYAFSLSRNSSSHYSASLSSSYVVLPPDSSHVAASPPPRWYSLYQLALCLSLSFLLQPVAVTSQLTPTLTHHRNSFQRPAPGLIGVRWRVSVGIMW